MDTPALELCNISCTFRPRSPAEPAYTAVADTSLLVQPGEFVSVVGPTGCGKSTLLNVAAGLLTPSLGEVRVFGQVLQGINVRAGYMFQTEALMPWRSALDNVLLGLQYHHTEAQAAQQLALDWLTRVGFAKPENVTDETVSILTTCAQQYGAEHAILGFLRNRRRFHVEDRLGNVIAPVHILWPEAAKGFDPAEGSELCRKLPNASLHILPEAATFAPMEMPTEIGTAISRWLDADFAHASIA